MADLLVLRLGGRYLKRHAALVIMTHVSALLMALAVRHDPSVTLSGAALIALLANSALYGRALIRHLRQGSSPQQ